MHSSRSILLAALAALAGASACSAPAPTATPTPTPTPTAESGHLVSVGRLVFVSGGVASKCNDGLHGQDYWGIGSGVDNRWLAAAPAWCAIDLGPTGATELLVGLEDENAGANVQGAPGFADYTLETSSDSTDGSDGTWTTAVTVSGNAYLYREHRIAFAGQRWVRISVTAPAAVALGELEAWDASGTTVDSLVWVGDSITARCSDRGGSYGAWPSFAVDVAAARPGHQPLQIGAGTVGITAGGVLSGSPSPLDTYLALFPDVKYWGLALGTNDSAADVPDATFRANLQAMVDAVRAAGHVPIIARIPYTADPAYGANTTRLNAVVDAVTAANSLTPGPDLQSLFQGHVAAYYDAADPVHPNKAGCTAWQGAWADVVAPLL